MAKRGWQVQKWSMAALASGQVAQPRAQQAGRGGNWWIPTCQMQQNASCLGNLVSWGFCNWTEHKGMNPWARSFSWGPSKGSLVTQNWVQVLALDFSSYLTVTLISYTLSLSFFIWKWENNDFCLTGLLWGLMRPYTEKWYFPPHFLKCFQVSEFLPNAVVLNHIRPHAPWIEHLFWNPGNKCVDKIAPYYWKLGPWSSSIMGITWELSRKAEFWTNLRLTESDSVF